MVQKSAAFINTFCFQNIPVINILSLLEILSENKYTINFDLVINPINQGLI